MREKRKIGPIAIGGGRRHFKKAGYSGRKARTQRAMQGGMRAEYTDEPEEYSYNDRDNQPNSNTNRDWELANVQGGR